MSKFKYNTFKKNLSWEKYSLKMCDNTNCKDKGEYKAPKSRILLNDYFYFCLNHIKEYNKSWNFYKGSEWTYLAVPFGVVFVDRFYGSLLTSYIVLILLALIYQFIVTYKPRSN